MKPVRFRTPKSIIKHLEKKLGREATAKDVKDLLRSLTDVGSYDWGEETFPEVFTGSIRNSTQEQAYKLFDKLQPIIKALAQEFPEWNQEMQ